MDVTGRPTLFEFAGGEPAFLALANAHHELCLADPELNHPFSHPGGNPQHIERLAAYWAEVMGGQRRARLLAGGRASAEWTTGAALVVGRPADRQLIGSCHDHPGPRVHRRSLIGQR